MSEKAREGPNILITGTPGTGKSRLASALAKSLGLKTVDVSKLALEKNLIDEFDTDRNVPVIDEDAVLDELEPLVSVGNLIVEYHACEFFPKRFFDRVVVLTTDNTVLYDRLKCRGYEEKKIKENVECEIFQLLVEEARDSYDEDVVVIYRNDSEDHFKSNFDAIRGWVLEWREVNS